MAFCPTCQSHSLTGYEASPGIEVEICPRCRGIFVDRDEIARLLGPGSLDQAVMAAPASAEAKRLPCPKCREAEMGPLAVEELELLEAWECSRCAGLWLGDGAFPQLRGLLRAVASPLPYRTRRQRLAMPGDRLAFGRSRHDQGMENLVAVPAALLLAWIVGSIPVGRLLAAFVGMTFHELGHAAASWISSRIAVPLPFVTFWSSNQSLVMGLVVLAVLGWLLVHTWRERNRFMFAAAAAVLFLWGVVTLLVPSERTLMWQILAGGLGELIFPAFLLIGFHFPLPDRLRWDFWRWIALFPAALSLVGGRATWAVAARDASRMPWGSALGSASDGDLNRLVHRFDWTGGELASFYLSASSVCLTAVALTWLYAAYRALATRAARQEKS